MSDELNAVREESAKFTVREQVGEGSMGRVVLARDNQLGRDVVMKTVSPALSDDPEAVTRFLDEARITGSLEHPNIVPIYEMGTAGNHEPYYAMRFVRGETLGAVVKRLADGDADTHERYSFSRRLAVVTQICEALHYAHNRGVLHRDIKPDNVMLGPFGEVLLMDWGIASHDGLGGTNRHELFCTPAYVAPELLQGEAASVRSEVYSLGALMYELFALRPPHDGKTTDHVLHAIVNKKARSAHSFKHPVQGHVPREINNIIMRALSRKPEGRYDDVAAVMRAIKDYQDGQAPVVCACTGAKRALFNLAALIDNHGELVIGGTLLVFGLAMVLGVAWWLTR